jgi:hypothetical protein
LPRTIVGRISRCMKEQRLSETSSVSCSEIQGSDFAVRGNHRRGRKQSKETEPFLRVKIKSQTPNRFHSLR